MPTPSELLDELAAELRKDPVALAYFNFMRAAYADDLRRLREYPARGTVLEMGAFPFYFSVCLFRSGYDLRIVDLNPHRGQIFLDAHDLKAVQCDMEREPLPFPSNSIGTAILAETFEHLRMDPLFVLEEASRVLSPGGILFLTTPNFYRLGNIARFLLGKGLANNPLKEYGKLRTAGHMGHVREYTASELREFLEAAGFADVRIERRCVPYGRWTDKLNSIIPLFRPEFVVIARKPRS